MGLGCYNTVLQRIGNIDVLIPMEVCKIIDKINHINSSLALYMYFGLFLMSIRVRERDQKQTIL